MRALGDVAAAEGVCYLGGPTAVLVGWRPTTIDVDIEFDPDQTSCCVRCPRSSTSCESTSS
jgi:hypothetical protein